MLSYKKLYHKLFNDITDVVFALEKDPHFDVLEKLKQSQIEAEDMYLCMCEEAFPNGEDLEPEPTDDI